MTHQFLPRIPRLRLAYAYFAYGYHIASAVNSDGFYQKPSLRTRFELKHYNFFLVAFSRLHFVASVPAITLTPYVVGYTVRHAL